MNTAGSNYYFSPEICKGEAHRGKPSDIWALGVTLYYMLFNEYPFTARSQDYKSLYRCIINKHPDFPNTYKDRSAIELIKQMLIKDTIKRPNVMDIMKHDWVTVTGKFPLENDQAKISNDFKDSGKSLCLYVL